MNILRSIYRRWYRFRVRLRRRHFLLGALAHVGSVVIMAFVLVLVFTLYILQPYRVSGESMMPTLSNGDRLFVLRSGKVAANALGYDYVPKRGEIVVFHSKLRDNKWIKRVIGLPGERIVIKNNIITIYSEERPEGFIFELEADPPLDTFPATEPVVDRIVGQGEIFVLGDNRLPQKSSDSRGSLGNIALDAIDGTVIIRVVPILEFRFF